MIHENNNHSFQIIMATIFVLILCICPVGFAGTDTDSIQLEIDPYMVYMEKYWHWNFSIEDVIKEEKELRSFSPAAEELVDDCNIHLIESDRISITVQQTLVDSIAGYLNFCFTSDQYILRPITCLDIYAPYYQSGDSYTQPVCFIEIEIGNCMGISSQAEGLSEDQKQFNLIAFCNYNSDASSSITESDVHLKVILHFFNSGEERIETMDFVFPINILENIDECHLLEPMIHEEYNLIIRGIGMVITPIRLSITPVGREKLDSSADCKYYWTLADQNGQFIFDHYNGQNGIYLSSIPEPIYYVVYQFDENGEAVNVFRQQLVRKDNIWTIQ